MRARGLAKALAVAIGALAFTAVLLAFLVPAVAAVIPALGGSDTAGGQASPGESLSSARIVSALRFTLTEAFLSAVVACIIGIPAAAIVARRDFPGRRFLLSLSGVPL